MPISLKPCGAGWQNLRPIVKIGLPLPPANLPAPMVVVCGLPLCGAGYQPGCVGINRREVVNERVIQARNSETMLKRRAAASIAPALTRRKEYGAAANTDWASVFAQYGYSPL
jgi:hypothetical protein